MWDYVPTRFYCCSRRGRTVGVGFDRCDGDHVDPSPRDHQSSTCVINTLKWSDGGLTWWRVDTSRSHDIHRMGETWARRGSTRGVGSSLWFDHCKSRSAAWSPSDGRRLTERRDLHQTTTMLRDLLSPWRRVELSGASDPHRTGDERASRCHWSCDQDLQTYLIKWNGSD